ncbi:MAG: DUF393 domain-containing protein [Verrucomicrobiota bacterium]
MNRISNLTVLFDASCGMCRGCRLWLSEQPSYFHLRFLALQSPKVDTLFPGVREYRPMEQLIVIDDHGGIYQGADAWVICLCALKEYRGLALKLADPGLRPLARSICQLISKNRHKISNLLGLKSGEAFRREAQKLVNDEIEMRPFCLCQMDGKC